MMNDDELVAAYDDLSPAAPIYSADRLTGLHSAQVMSQSMPWIAREAGLFQKHDLDFRLVFIPSSPVATAATLNGDAEIAVTGAVSTCHVGTAAICI